MSEIKSIISQNLTEEKISEQKKRIQNVGKFGPAYHKKYNALHGKKYWDKIKQGKIESKFKMLYGKKPTPKELSQWLKGKSECLVGLEISQNLVCRGI